MAGEHFTPKSSLIVPRTILGAGQVKPYNVLNVVFPIYDMPGLGDNFIFQGQAATRKPSKLLHL